MALEVAKHFPEQCKAVISIGTPSFIEDKTIKGIQAAREHFKTPKNLEKLKKYHGDRAQWIVSSWVDTWLAPEFLNWTIDNIIKDLECPVLAIHGTQDEFGSIEQAKRIASVKRGHVGVIKEVGHMPHHENEELTLKLIKKFLMQLNK
ncbi:MAG: hypothetical protein DHS20C07_31510 [Methyloligella sp.]|jgi:pimeloyl-ACP methyl ester carboxylesterase|nr:MAG: hypothetical protein DHS20C07_31510 [Methyloligella sp.]